MPDDIPKDQRLTDSAGNEIRHLNEFTDRYDAQILYQDRCLGRVLDALDLEQTVAAIVANHGETLGDRKNPYNLNLGTSVFGEQTQELTPEDIENLCALGYLGK